MGLLSVEVGTGLDVTNAKFRTPRASLGLWEGDPLRCYPRHRPGAIRAKQTQWCIRVEDGGARSLLFRAALCAIVVWLSPRKSCSDPEWA